MSRVVSVLAKRRRGATVFTVAPFAGEGTSLYANRGSAVTYRELRVIPRRRARAFPAIRKTSRVDSVLDPTAAFSYAIPVGWASTDVVFDVRRFRDNVENLATNFDTVKMSLDGSLNDTTGIKGRATLLSPEIRAGGVVRLRFRYHRSESGLDPVSFAWSRTAGPTIPADSTVAFEDGVAVYEVDTAALSDASAYTYKLTAVNGGSSVDLLTGVTFTPDASGPPAATLGSAEAW